MSRRMFSRASWISSRVFISASVLRVRESGLLGGTDEPVVIVRHRLINHAVVDSGQQPTRDTVPDLGLQVEEAPIHSERLTARREVSVAEQLDNRHIRRLLAVRSVQGINVLDAGGLGLATRFGLRLARPRCGLLGSCAGGFFDRGGVVLSHCTHSLVASSNASAYVSSEAVGVDFKTGNRVDKSWIILASSGYTLRTSGSTQAPGPRFFLTISGSSYRSMYPFSAGSMVMRSMGVSPVVSACAVLPATRGCSST